MSDAKLQMVKQAGLLKRHLNRFERNFTAKGKLPRDKDWRVFRFAVRDAILGLQAIRHQTAENVIEVDVFVSDDPDEIVGFSGTKISVIFILSEAYKCGANMSVKFTTEFGTQPVVIPGQVFDMAWEYGVELKFAEQGVITPKEARMLYLALTEFSPEAEARVKQLALEYKVTPERACYMVHHLTYTKEEMEAILLGSEHPENILLGKVTPQESLLYADVALRARDVVLGGNLNRKLRQKEIVNEDGTVLDLEGNDRRVRVSFDSRFFANVYDLEEDTPIPWTNVQKEWVVPAGDRLVVMIRGRDYPDTDVYYQEDVTAAQAMVEAYSQSQMQTHYFVLMPRDVLDVDRLGPILEAYAEMGITLMMDPRTTSVLDEDVRDRLRESESMRHDVGTGEGSDPLRMELPDWRFNASDVTLVAVPGSLKIGRLKLNKLLEQAMYDEAELKTGVNKHNVRSRHLRVIDRMQFLAHQALQAGKCSKVRLPGSVLQFMVANWWQQTELLREKRLVSMYWVPDHISDYVRHLRQMLEGSVHPVPSAVEVMIQFLIQAKQQNQVVVAVQNKHVEFVDPEYVSPDTSRAEEIKPAFAGQFVIDYVPDNEGKTAEDILIRQIWASLLQADRGQSNSVNLGVPGHAVISNALHYFVYKHPDNFEGPTAFNVTYTDGSTGHPFPVFCLRRPSKGKVNSFKSGQPKNGRFGMISFRHPEMDAFVDQYWFRNIEISQAEYSMAEMEALCYQITYEKLQVLAQRGARLRMFIVQTGLQPAVVGFYRGVVDFLLENRDRQDLLLEVVPLLYDSRYYRERIEAGEKDFTNHFPRGKSWM